MEKLDDGSWYVPADEANKLFKRFEDEGFFVDRGRNTGNIWSKDREKKIYWMIKDFDGNWSIEPMF